MTTPELSPGSLFFYTICRKTSVFIDFYIFYDKKGLSLGWVYGMIGKELSGVKGIK